MFNPFFRAIGLGIVNFALLLLGHKSLQEAPKIILQESWSSALIRNVIHIIPVGGAITIAYLNLAGHYLGASFSGIPALQFAAKLHEILMIASLSQIMLHVIRNELTSKCGIPLGGLISGFQISQLRYLWSLELWGVLTASAFSWWRKLRFIIVVIFCITLAASIGPSSAVGMIPRVKPWPTGSFTIWSNATAAQLYPRNVSAEDIPQNCAISPLLSVNTACPWSGW